MDVVYSGDGTVYSRIQRQHNEIPTLPPRHSILPVICIQRRDAGADSTSATAHKKSNKMLQIFTDFLTDCVSTFIKKIKMNEQ